MCTAQYTYWASIPELHLATKIENVQVLWNISYDTLLINGQKEIALIFEKMENPKKDSKR